MPLSPLYITTCRNGKIIPVNNLVIGLMAQHLFYVVGFQAHDLLNFSRAVVDQPDSQSFIVPVLKFYRRTDAKIVLHRDNTTGQQILPFSKSAFTAPSSILMIPLGFNEKAIQHLRLASFCFLGIK